jgi:DNA-binding transcriptional MerR regulator
MIDRLVKIGEAARIMGVTPVTMRRWEKSGKLLPSNRSAGDTRYYRVSDLVLAGGVSE